MLRCCDLNSRIPDQADCIGYLDDVPSRVAIGLTIDGHGESFLDFLRDSECCVFKWQS